MKMDTLMISLRPKISLSFARMTNTPISTFKVSAKISDLLTLKLKQQVFRTNVSKEIARYNPTNFVKASEVIGDSHQRCRNDGYL